MSNKPRVAVLGAGIMGCCTALQLARGGCAVTILDQASAPMTAASRWNEGKIHLGFLYAGDPSGRTAERLISGGVAFRPIIEDLIGEPIEGATTAGTDLYLVHQDSVVDVDAMARYFRMLDERLAAQPGYLAPLTRTEPIRKAELEGLACETIVAGFRVPERSINTIWLADRLATATLAEPRIEFMPGRIVRAVHPVSAAWNGPWRVECEPPVEGEHDIVVNALWQGRAAADVRSGFDVEGEHSHRYRLALFVETEQPVDVPSMVVATGPFGDIKNYDRRSFYLSWYRAGLIASGDGIEPPDLPAWRPADVAAATIRGLASVVPGAQAIIDAAVRTQVAGGWVFAAGSGSLADPHSTLHQRDKFGVRRRGTYYSVDTGKYSTAPWLAQGIVGEILEGKAW